MTGAVNSAPAILFIINGRNGLLLKCSITGTTSKLKKQNPLNFLFQFLKKAETLR